MDWLNQENNILIEDEADSFSNNNLIDIENLLMQKQNSINDFEVKIDDFYLHNKSEPLNSKILFDMKEQSDYKFFDIKCENKSKKTFKIDKNDYPLRESNLNKKLQEELNDPLRTIFKIKEKCIQYELNYNFRHSHKDSSTASMEDGSEFLISTKNEIDQNIEKSSKRTDETTESNKKIINFKSLHEGGYLNSDCDSLLNNNSYSEEINENNKLYFDLNINNKRMNLNESSHMAGINFYNCNDPSQCPFYVPLQNLPLTERMKIKKERVKLLLEKKRESNTSLSYPNKLMSFTNYQKESVLNTSASTNYLVTQNLSDNKKNGNILFDEMLNNINSSQYSKKEIKMLRNRVSAQRSRDRKKAVRHLGRLH